MREPSCMLRRMAPSGFSEQELPELVAKQLTQFVEQTGLGDNQVVIVPRHIRGGSLYYDDEDLESLKLARSVQLDASDFGEESRTYLHEYSAGWEAEVALAIAANLTADSIIAMSRFLCLKVFAAVARGLHPGPAEIVPLKVQASRVITSGDSSDIRSFVAEGPAGEVLEALVPGLATLGVEAAVGLEPLKPFETSEGASQDEGHENHHN